MSSISDPGSGGIRPDGPRGERPKTGKVDSVVSAEFLKTMEKIVQKKLDLAEGAKPSLGDRAKDKIVEVLKKPLLPNVVSEEAKEKDVSKRGFLSGAWKNFRSFLSKASKKVSKGDIFSREKKEAKEVEHIQKVEQSFASLSPEARDKGTEILGKVNDFLVKGLLDRCYSVEDQINDLLKEKQLPKFYRKFFKQLKMELGKQPPSEETLKNFVSDPVNAAIVDELFPSFALRVDSTTFKGQFATLVEGHCSAIEKNLDEEGPFRRVGQVKFQSIITRKILKKESMDPLTSIHDHCGAMKTLFGQLLYLKKAGILSEEEVDQLKGSFERVNNLLTAVKNNTENKLNKDQAVALAASEIAFVINKMGYNDFKLPEELATQLGYQW